MPYDPPDPAATSHLPRELNGENARRWALAYIAHLLDKPVEAIDLYRPFSDYGLDSLDAVVMAGEMEEHFSVELDPGIFLQEATTLGALLDQRYGPRA